jgi:hypothetical protein
MFSIRALSLVEALAPNARVSVAEAVGAKFDFKKGVSISITFPSDPAAFASLSEPDRILAAPVGWARVYRYPKDKGHAIHVIAPAEEESGDIRFYRLDLWQRLKLRGPKAPVEIVGGAIMNFDECASWLVDLAERWRTSPDDARQFQCLSKVPTSQADLRMAWIGPEIIDGRLASERLNAIGDVYDATLVQVSPISFRYVEAQLKLLAPLDAAVICDHYAPYITEDVVPESVTRDFIHVCNSSTRVELEQQIRTWLELASPEIRSRAQSGPAEEEHRILLNVMLQGMLSHSKIGPNNHCQKETVLKRIRARHLNAASAERILDENSEHYESASQSDSLFLWKDHNDGKQYFLNPKQVPQIKTILNLLGATGSTAVV